MAFLPNFSCINSMCEKEEKHERGNEMGSHGNIQYWFYATLKDPWDLVISLGWPIDLSYKAELTFELIQELW